jgi:hypothetical protein
MAEIEHSLGIRASYYFRDVPESLYPGVITKIAAMGHEIGYHYENLSVCALKLRIKKEKLREINAERISIESDHETRTLFECAIKDFKHSLGKLKKLAPISTIAMHGRPGVPIDNRLLWKVYDYRSFGIIAEPYFNVDYNEVLYITDAGRTWFDPKANQRDKVDSKYEFVFHSTDEIIQAINSKQLPSKMIINIHPEHWADNTIEWYKIKMVRSTRNLIKRIIL